MEDDITGGSPVIAYRLFRRQEIDELSKFLLNQNELQKQFPDYKIWVKKIIPQIISSAERSDNDIKSWRLAFGLFKGIPTDDKTNKQLIGTTLINLSTSNCVELKSFYICPEDRGKSYSKKLFDIVHNHCARHGIRKIETSILSSDIKTLSLFLKQGYQIINEEDVYLIDQPRIRMKKELVPFYDGDPFDWEQISIWFIYNFLKAYDIKPVRGGLSFNVDLSTINFSQETRTENQLSDVSNHKFNLTIKGLAYVKEKADIQKIKAFINRCKKEKKHLIVFLIKSINKKIRNYIEKNNLIYFDENKISRESHKFEPPPFSKKDISGMFVEVKSNYFENIQSKRNFIYFKGARIGHHLRKGNVVFLFVLPSRNEIKGQILGFGYLNEKPSIGHPEVEWNKYKNKALLSKEDYDQFTQNKDKIMSMYLQNFKRIPPIDFETITQITKQKLEPEDIHQQYISEITTSNLIKLLTDSKKPQIDFLNCDTVELIRDFVYHCQSNCLNSFWTKNKKLKPEPENIAKNLLVTHLRPRYYTYKEVKTGNGFVDILARPKGETNKHTLIELKINDGEIYIQKGIKRLKYYILNSKDYNLQKEVYYLIFDFTTTGTAKKFDKGKIQYKGHLIQTTVIGVPSKNTTIKNSAIHL